jgi:hypothetical protein
MNFSNAEFADMHFVYGFCDGNSSAAMREYRRRFPNRRVPSKNVFTRLHQRLKETGSFSNTHFERASDYPEEVLQKIELDPSTSVRRISRETNISRMKVHRTIKHEKLYPYHIQKVQHLLPTDHAERIAYCRWLIANRHLNILFTDESVFTRDGVTNQHNSHVYAQENPKAVTLHHFQHRFSVNVWCGIIGPYLIGPYIFEGVLNGRLYLDFLQNELNGLLEDLPLNIRQLMYFQQDGAPPHYSAEVRQHLSNVYPGRWIGRGGPVLWPPRSPDLTPLDYYIWSEYKRLVYENRTKPQTRDELLDRIRQAGLILGHNQEVLERVNQQIYRRARLCIEENGAHFEHKIH